MKRYFVLIALVLVARNVLAWGQKGHDVTACIAEAHLTPEAAERIDRILGGHSPVYYANWMDIASHTSDYEHTRTWHYLNVDEDKTIEETEPNPDGDVLTAVTAIVRNLRQGGLSEKEEFDNLRMLIHLIGDMHCPMHFGRRDDLGGNKVPVSMFGRSTSLHSAFDTAIVESAHKWSYTEWWEQIDRLTDGEAVTVVAGEPRDWCAETVEICNRIYDETPEGTRISYDYVDKYTPVIELQFVRGGRRLAKLLNEIYR